MAKIQQVIHTATERCLLWYRLTQVCEAQKLNLLFCFASSMYRMTFLHILVFI